MGVRETYRDRPHIKPYQRRLNLSSGGGGSVEKQAAQQDLRDEKEKLRTQLKFVAAMQTQRENIRSVLMKLR